MITLSNFTRVSTEYSQWAYQNGIWTFDITTQHDLEPYVRSAQYQKFNSMLPIDNRQHYIQGSDTTLDQTISILDSLVFTKIKELVFNDPFEQPFKDRWPVTQDQFDSKFFAMTTLFKDPPNFSMGKHLDNQHVMGNAIINLTDNDSSTIFLDYQNPKNKVFSTKGTKNTGVFFLNTPACLHTIENQHSDRYISNTVLMIKW